jgi:quinate dehydrogenase
MNAAPVPPPHPSAQEIASSSRRHRLFGFPIAHSASPAFQNTLLRFQAGPSNLHHVPTYSLCETKSVEETHFYNYVRHDPLHGGSGVTMPLKVAVASKLGPDHILDELDHVGRATMTVNTIVVLPSLKGETSVEKRRMIGTNTDYLGIRHALLRSVASQNGLHPAAYMSQDEPYIFPAQVSPQSGDIIKPSAFIIGSGGTCRSAVWALHNLGLSPLYLLNRDEEESLDVVRHFASMDIDLRPLRSVEAFEAEKKLRDQGKIGKIVAAVGAIPAFEPSTADEKMVYTLAHSFFSESYEALQVSIAPAPSSKRNLPLPSKRPFLDMCYKPRLTPLLKFAGKTQTWDPIGGVEAMVEQGLAQARMWAASACILSGKIPRDDPLSYATREGDDGPLGKECEEEARRLVQSMSDVVVVSPTAPAATIVDPSVHIIAAIGTEQNAVLQPQSVH